MENIFSQVPELDTLFSTVTFPFALIAVIVGIALAFHSTKLFKICITFVGTVFFGIIGCDVVAPLILAAIGDAALELPFNISPIIGFVFALIGYFLTYKLYKFAIFLFGGAIGYFLGNAIATLIAVNNPDVEFLTSELFLIIVSIVCAIILGYLTLFIFKFLYIFTTSFSGMIVACLAAYIAIAPEDMVYLVIFGILALILSIIAMVYQYKQSKGM